MSEPRFTFCIPNLNKIEFLPACIESMLAQDCPDWKCVFVDGYSTDGCWEYMQQFADDSRFLLLRGLRQGMYADWNYCLKHVDTEYFYILTSDDTCYPSLISQTLEALDKYQDVDVCHFKYALIDKRGEIIFSPEEWVKMRCPIYSESNKYMHRRSGLSEFLMHYVYGTIYTTVTSLVFRSSLLEKMQAFSTEHGSVGDYDWTMRLGAFTDVLYIPNLLATWRIYPEQATLQNTSLKSAEGYLEISRKNLKFLLENDHRDRKHKLLLSKTKDFYISQSLKSAYSSGVKSIIIFLTFRLTRLDVSYPLRKIIRRLSRNKFFRYDLNLFARQVVEKYAMVLPPEIIDDVTLSAKKDRLCTTTGSLED